MLCSHYPPLYLQQTTQYRTFFEWLIIIQPTYKILLQNTNTVLTVLKKKPTTGAFLGLLTPVYTPLAEFPRLHYNTPTHT
jgi:hypothetical protein